MSKIIASGTEEAESTIVLKSGRPGYVLVAVEGATSGGYYAMATHRKITKEEQEILDKKEA